MLKSLFLITIIISLFNLTCGQYGVSPTTVPILINKEQQATTPIPTSTKSLSHGIRKISDGFAECLQAKIDLIKEQAKLFEKFFTLQKDMWSEKLEKCQKERLVKYFNKSLTKVN